MGWGWNMSAGSLRGVGVATCSSPSDQAVKMLIQRLQNAGLQNGGSERSKFMVALYEFGVLIPKLVSVLSSHVLLWRYGLAPTVVLSH